MDRAFTIDAFLAAKASGGPYVGKAGSPKTIATYRSLLKLAERLAGKPLADFTEDDTMVMLKAARDEGLAATTQETMLSVLRSAFAWAIDTKRRDGDNFFAWISGPPTALHLPRAISQDDVNRILATVPGVAPKGFGEKYQLIFEVQAGCGLRLSEVLQLRGTGLRPNGIAVIGKGNKERFVPARPDLLARLRSFVDPADPGAFLFRGEGPNSYRDWPLSQSMPTRIFKKAVIKAGFDPEKITPHVLRHSFATYALRRTCRVELVQDLLGHARPTTTRNCSTLGETDLEDAYARIWID